MRGRSLGKVVSQKSEQQGEMMSENPTTRDRSRHVEEKDGWFPTMCVFMCVGGGVGGWGGRLCMYASKGGGHVVCVRESVCV